MKICLKCGAQQTDNRNFCIDCGEKLGKSIPKKEAENIKLQTEDKIDKLYNKNDTLSVSVPDKIIGLSAIIGAIAASILSIIFKDNSANTPYAVSSVLLFIYCALNALLPKMMWTIEKVRLSFTIKAADNAIPSSFYLIMRKIAVYGCFIFAVIFLVYVIIGK